MVSSSIYMYKVEGINLEASYSLFSLKVLLAFYYNVIKATLAWFVVTAHQENSTIIVMVEVARVVHDLSTIGRIIFFLRKSTQSLFFLM